MEKINNFLKLNKGKKRDNEDVDSYLSADYPPRVRVRVEQDMDVNLNYNNNDNYNQQPFSLTPSSCSPCPSPSSYSTFSTFNFPPGNLTYNQQLQQQQINYFSQEPSVISSYAPSQEDNEVSCVIKLSQMSINDSQNSQRMSVDNIMEIDQTREKITDINENMKMVATSTIKEIFSLDQDFEFVPLLGKFLKIGEEIFTLYEKANHNKELCGFLLKRCNEAMVAVRDLDTRKTENTEFFFKRENLTLFMEFIECMRKVKKFISRISKLYKLIKYFVASSIELDFNYLLAEFDGYMRSLNFSFVEQSSDEISKMRNEIRQIRDLLHNVYGISDDRQSLLDYSNRMSSLILKNIDFQSQTSQPRHVIEDSSDIETAEPLLEGKQYVRTYIHTRKIEKRTSIISCDEFCFKEFSNNYYYEKWYSEQTQIEMRRQVNILKELKNSDYIIKFYGVAEEDNKYYLVTEWMEHGNLYEYYTTYGETIDWNTKIKFALDICRGVAYIHDCKILHRDIQSKNILVNGNHKAKIANFGLNKKFSDVTRNNLHNIEIIRYMAPEKLLLDDDNNGVKKRVSYDFRCEIYSVGVLLWEIAELKKPHSDLGKADILVGIRKRARDRYSLPFSYDVPSEWRTIVTGAMEFEPTWRRNITDICRDFYDLSRKYQQNQNGDEIIVTDGDDDAPSNQNIISVSVTTNTILSVEDAIRTYKSENGNEQLAWQSFKHHSPTNIEAKYWLGYCYYHDKEIPELQKIDRKERCQTAAEIFKETADKGNPSAQLRYGICLWQGDGVKVNSVEAIKYLKLAAEKGNSSAMYITGKAYWNGGNGIRQNIKLGAQYLKDAAACNHPKAKEMCAKNNISLI